MTHGVIETALEMHSFEWTVHDGDVWALVPYTEVARPGRALVVGAEHWVSPAGIIGGKRWERITARTLGELRDWLGY